MAKINCLNPIAKCGTDLFDASYEMTDNLNEADAVLVRSASMHELEVPDSLLAVARAGAGVNNIPLDAYAEKGIVVFNTPGANANGVKELVIAGLLLGSRDIVAGANWVVEDKDDDNIAKTAEKQKKLYAGNEIQGKKLGVIGLGAIGCRVANAAVHLGMEVLGYDPFVSVDAAWNLSKSVKHIKNVNDIYSECDYITIHVPLMDATKGMINEEAISMMKDGVVILNYARDILVDEPALMKAIDAGKVASTAESEDNCAVMAVNEIRDFIENGNVVNSVNYPKCDAGVPSSAGRITVCHKNIPNMLTQFTGAFSKAGINVPDMVSKSRGDYAYTILDVDTPDAANMVAELEAIDGVIRVRVVK